jgi:hypothetical protein
LDEQATVRAAARARESAGSRMPIRTAMMPITTSSSTSVNAVAFGRLGIINLAG